MLRLLPLALAVFIATSSLGTSDAQANNDQPFNSLARTIMDGLNSAAVDSLPANNGYGPPRIAVRTVGRDSTTNEATEDYTQRMLTALQHQTRGRFTFVALDSLDRLILDIKAEDLSPADSKARIRDLRANARADVLVAGVLRKSDGETSLSYQAINTDTGALLASTAIKRINPFTPSNSTPIRTPGRPGRYRATVQEAEQLLVDKGYDPGPIDGYMTPKTRQALRAYQLDSAMPVNGRLTRRVVNNLRRDTRSVTF
jgi:hypothetical protein